MVIGSTGSWWSPSRERRGGGISPIGTQHTNWKYVRGEGSYTRLGGGATIIIWEHQVGGHYHLWAHQVGVPGAATYGHTRWGCCHIWAPKVLAYGSLTLSSKVLMWKFFAGGRFLFHSTDFLVLTGASSTLHIHHQLLMQPRPPRTHFAAVASAGSRVGLEMETGMIAHGRSKASHGVQTCAYGSTQQIYLFEVIFNIKIDEI